MCCLTTSEIKCVYSCSLFKCMDFSTSFSWKAASHIVAFGCSHKKSDINSCVKNEKGELKSSNGWVLSHLRTAGQSLCEMANVGLSVSRKLQKWRSTELPNLLSERCSLQRDSEAIWPSDRHVWTPARFIIFIMVTILVFRRFFLVAWWCKMKSQKITDIHPVEIMCRLMWVIMQLTTTETYCC